MKLLIFKYLNKFRVFKAILTSQYALMLEYRAEIALWALSGILPLIMLSIWMESGATKTYNIEIESLYKYFISVFIVRQFTAVWVMVSFEKDNIEGRLSPFLLQPVQPFYRYYFSHIAEQISRLPIVIIMLLILFIFNPNYFWVPKLVDIILGLLSIYLAFTVRFLMHWFFSILCFWSDRISSIERLLLIPYIFLSGLVAPIEIYPDSIKKIIMITPFPYILAFPAKILSGEDINYILVFIPLVIWIIILTLLSILLWNIGIRKYSSMGA